MTHIFGRKTRQLAGAPFFNGIMSDNHTTILQESSGISLGTLADRTAIKGTAFGLTEDVVLVKSEYLVHVDDLPLDDGPVFFGIADENLTVAEIKECLDQDGPKGPELREETEQASRPVFLICQMGQGQGNSLNTIVPNDGMPIVRTHKWVYRSATGWNHFAFNDSGEAFATGGVLRFQAKHYVRWIG